jgi:molybdate transport system regulatory protein
MAAMEQQDKLKLNARVWFEQGETNLAGATEVSLLAAIAETGSITQAAKAIGRSYKWAWDTVEAMNQLAGEPLVQREAGGRNGGGTRLTEHGERLIDSYRAIERAHQQFVAALSSGVDDFGDCYQLLRKVALKTSARNQLFGQVVTIGRGLVNDEVELELAGGDRIRAVITHASTERLGLAPGMETVALVKANWVTLSLPSGQVDPALNHLQGTVRQLTSDALNTEVIIDLPGGSTLCSMVPHDAAQALGLTAGQRVDATFHPSNLILGVPM